GQAAMSAELSAGPAEVYFCGDDILSIGAMAAIGAAGLRCPDDIGILGLNDMAMAAWTNISLTTIAQPIEAIVGAALSLVVRLSEYPSPQAEAQMFPCHLVERASLRALNP
ncbi:MAG: substrate-binding domain-containing protein, partial [Paracoccaceae bacterium]